MTTKLWEWSILFNSHGGYAPGNYDSKKQLPLLEFPGRITSLQKISSDISETSSDCLSVRAAYNNWDTLRSSAILLQYYTSKGTFCLGFGAVKYTVLHPWGEFKNVLQECLWLKIKSALLSSRCSCLSYRHVLCGNNWHHSLGKKTAEP